MTEGKMGYAPDWYSHLQAAKYLEVAPWDLAEAGFWWKIVAMKSMDAEAQARKILESRK